MREIVFVVSAIAGFIFWPAWIVTGIAFLLLPGGNSEPSRPPKRNGNLSAKSFAPSVATESLKTLKPKSSVAVEAQAKIGVSYPPSVPAPKATIGATGVKNFALPTGASERNLILSDIRTADTTPRILTVATKVPSQSTASSRIKEIVNERRITQLVHFTRCENLASILERGLISVEHLEMDRVEAVRNDELRLDGKLGAVSLSVSFPNYKMFYKYRCETPKADWAVLLLNPAILSELHCAFYPLNAADHRMRRLPLSDATCPEALESLFADSEAHRDPLLRPCDPTDVQAEVMTFQQIDPSFIMSIAFENYESKQRWNCWTGRLETTIEGRGRGVFGARTPVLAN